MKDFIADICRISKVDASRLTKSIRGTGGDPERRFAVWAFRTSTHLTYRQIGEQLKMTPEHVARDVRRNRKKIEQFEEWADNWLERYISKVSIV